MAEVSIGSLNFLPSHGRLGVVVGAQTVGAPEHGRQLVALKLKTVGEPSCDGCKPKLALEPVPAPGPGPAPGPVPEPYQVALPRSAPVSLAVAEPTGRNGLPPAEHEPLEPASAAANPDDLSAEQRQMVDQLRQRDAQVRQEEKAHAAVAGDLAGPISYVYRRGPDGRQYAVGGSVAVHAQSVSGDPQDAARIGARMAAAGHAATNPSGADLAAVRAGYRLQGDAAQAAGQSRSGQPRSGLDISV